MARPLSQSPKFFWKRIRLAESATQPLRTCCHSLVSYQDRYLIAFGGGSLTGMSKEVFIYDLERNEWEHKGTHHAEFVPARVIHSAVIYKDQMIVYGGHSDDPPGILDDVLTLDLDRWSWGSIGPAPPEPDGPGAREFHTAHIYQDRMYVIMGHLQDQVDAPPLSADREADGALVWYLDLVDCTWHVVRPPDAAAMDEAPPHRLGGHAAAVEGDTVYLFGGTSSRIVVDDTQYSNELYTFNFRTHRWRRIRAAAHPQPRGRYGSGLAVCNGVVYLFGGDCTDYVVFGDFWRIDTTSSFPVWEELPLLEPSRSGNTADAHPPPLTSIRETLGQGTTTTRTATTWYSGLGDDGGGSGGGAHPHSRLDSATSSSSSSSGNTSASRGAAGGLGGTGADASLGWWTPRSWHNLDRPTPRSGMGYTTARGAFYILGGETTTEPSVPLPPIVGWSGGLPVGMPDAVYNMPRGAAEYSNELFTYPLTVSLAASLRDAASRWLTSVWAGEGRWLPREVGRVRETEPVGVLYALQGCLPSSVQLLREARTEEDVVDGI